MNIVILTAEEPLYLPRFFTQYLAARAADTKAIFLAPTRYGKDTTLGTLRKYWGAFGFMNLCQLVARTGWVKIADRLGVGRSRGEFHSIPAVARHYGVRCETVRNVNDEAFRSHLKEIGTDLLVSVSCPQIFKQPLIELPPRGCLNIHGALLPRYRGIAPSFWMMAHGEQTAGVTVFFVTRSIDLGDVVEQRQFPILPLETLSQFIVRSKQIACEALLAALNKIEAGPPETYPIRAEGGSYFSFPTRDAYRQFRQRGRRLW
jgi:methionyl-tRNA formyltransferase